MSFGKRVKTEIKASNIAIPVKTPKYIVGIKLDKTKIEKPKTIVIDVFNIATPTVLYKIITIKIISNNKISFFKKSIKLFITKRF